MFLLGCANPLGSSAAVSSNYHPGIPGATSASMYYATVLSDNPTYYWRVGEASGSLANDSVGSNPGTLLGTFTWGISGAPIGDSNTALSLTTNGFFYSSTFVAGPTIFSLEVWFKTATLTGGKLIGFGNSQIPASSNYDRHIYMTNSGQIIFGCYPGSVQVVTSPASYNDGKWHHAVGTLSLAGMVLYMDGVSVGTNPATTAQAYSGYWRIGYDNLNSWTNVPASYYFNGSLDEIAVYMTQALTASKVLNHYTAAQ